jgi:hypothetical protein
VPLLLANRCGADDLTKGSYSITNNKFEGFESARPHLERESPGKCE